MPLKPKTKKTSTSQPHRTRSATRLINQAISEVDTSPTTQKRKATSPNQTPEAKKTIQPTMSITLADLEAMFEKQTATLNQSMKTMGDELKLSFLDEIKNLHERVEAIESNVSVQISCLRTDVDTCINRVNSNDDDLIRMSKLNELRINGIAHTSNENMHDIFCSIANHIGYDISSPTSIPDIVRMHKRNNQTNDFIPMPSMIMKFVAAHIRNNFYGLYLAKATREPILSERINLPQGSTIRISEVLTPQNQTIFTEAIKSKRDKKLLKVKTVDGLVRVKSTQSEGFVTIRSHRELDLYIMSKSQLPPMITAASAAPVVSTPPVSTLSTAASAPTSTNESTLSTLSLDNNALGYQQFNSVNTENTEGIIASGHQTHTQSTANQMHH